MTENDKGPQKIDLEELLGAEETAGTPSESEEIEILDPVTGDPVRKKGAREGDDANRYEDLYLRTRADFENYRKRIERERVEERSRAAAGLVEELLPVLDSLERALGGTQEGDPFRDGVALIHRQMKDTLARAGLEPIEALGAMFDPIYHDAVATEQRDDLEPNQVIDVIQPGYLFQGRVLRHALVRVAAGGAQKAGEQGGETET